MPSGGGAASCAQVVATAPRYVAAANVAAMYRVPPRCPNRLSLGMLVPFSPSLLQGDREKPADNDAMHRNRREREQRNLGYKLFASDFVFEHFAEDVVRRVHNAKTYF